MKTKICTKCKRKQLLKNFYKRAPRKSRSKYGKPYKKRKNNTVKEEYQQRCKDCYKQQCHKYYLCNKEKYKQRSTAWKKVHRTERRIIAHEARLSIISFFGGKCVRCPFTDERALQLDHINGDGYKDKRSHWAKTWYVLKLIKQNPEKARKKFQLLCANCNWIKRVENHEY